MLGLLRLMERRSAGERSRRARAAPAAGPSAATVRRLQARARLVLRHLGQHRVDPDLGLHPRHIRRQAVQRGRRARAALRLTDADPGRRLSLAGRASPKALSSRVTRSGVTELGMPFDNIGRPGPGRGAGERAINLPPAVMWLIVINVAIQLLRTLLGDETDSALIQQFGLVPAAYTAAHQDLVTQVVAPIS